MPIEKSGFLYVYTSNESPQDVFFDNVTLGVASGPVLEETHYYPFGGTLAGISYKALKGAEYPENRYKYNGIEKIGDLGLEDYDAKFRELDPQIGRWWQIDPKIDNMEAWSPYASMYDNPIRYSDPLGDEPGDDPPGWRKVLASVLGTINGLEQGMGFRGVDAGSFPFTEAETQYYNTATQVGQVGAFLFSKPGGASRPEPVPVLAGGKLPVIPVDAIAPTGTLVLPLPPGSKTKVEAQGKYSHLKEPRNVGPGKKTTSGQRKRILEDNKRQNNGKLISDGDGRELNPPKKNEKGQSADMTQAEVDHAEPRARGGSNSNSNLRVISKEENLRKGLKPLEP